MSNRHFKKNNSILFVSMDCSNSFAPMDSGAESPLPSNNSTLYEILTQYGFDTFIAVGQKNALHLIKNTSPDIIIIEDSCPDNHFADTITKIRSLSTSASTPIIILSNSTDVDSRISAFLAGANDYIEKPLALAELIARINAQLRVSTIQAELEKKNRELVAKNNFKIY